MQLSDSQLADLIEIRRTLHQMPELSGDERETAVRICQYLKRFGPDGIVKGIGGEGVAAIFDSDLTGASVTVRCELDGLPIEETGNLAYRSQIPGRGHQCGHDGHMAILIGVAAMLAENRPARGRVVLLFQPAEETGKGARAVVADQKFAAIRTDHFLSVHNMPGHEAHRILLRTGHVNCASRGMCIKLTGKTAHASMPETGISPAPAIAEIIGALNAIPTSQQMNEDFALATIVHANLGERAFGVAPAHGEVWATLRTVTDGKMHRLVQTAEAIAGHAADKHNLGLEIRYDDIFNACENDAALIEHLRESANRSGYAVEDLHEPLRFSEDFGEYGNVGSSAMFFIGAGTDLPALHNPDYDFPDELINTGVTMFYTTVCRLLGQNA
ncbi:MAG: amidohydrolase [Hyphomicrobiales bacterium]|nr:amidohydrolase [Hyphomicrobiales bacterium]MCP4998536.1 amidohydrolase [Hyphomicrobiales bacterium]